MNIVDRRFKALVEDIKSKSEKEIYYHIRKKYDLVAGDIKKSMEDFFNSFDFWGKLDSENGIYEEIEKKGICLYNYIDDFEWLYDRLADYRSKMVLYSIINNWYNYDFVWTTKTVENMYDDYFDLDLVKVTDDEVIVDLGAYTGDSMLSYINNYGTTYKKAYLYEVTKESFEILKNNLKDYNNLDFRYKGVGNEKGKMKVSLHNIDSSANTAIYDEEGEVMVVTLDEDIDDKITLIKADIEGWEKKALEGAERHIVNEHPKLLISVYHSNNDLWEIPKMIDRMDNSYKFYLRYKSSPIYPTEVTLIAI